MSFFQLRQWGNSPGNEVATFPASSLALWRCIVYVNIGFHMFPPFASSTTLETHGFPIVQRPYVAKPPYSASAGGPPFPLASLKDADNYGILRLARFLGGQGYVGYVSSFLDDPHRIIPQGVLQMCPIEKVITPKITWFIMMFPVNIVILCSKLGALLSFEHSPDSDLPALPRQSPELFQHLWWCSAGLVIGHLPWYSLGLRSVLVGEWYRLHTQCGRPNG